MIQYTIRYNLYDAVNCILGVVAFVFGLYNALLLCVLNCP